jgi:hypothetical protein
MSPVSRLATGVRDCHDEDVVVFRLVDDLVGKAIRNHAANRWVGLRRQVRPFGPGLGRLKTSNQRSMWARKSSPRSGRCESYQAASWKSSSSASGWSLSFTAAFPETSCDALACDVPVDRLDGTVGNLARATSDLGGPGGVDVEVANIVEAADQVLCDACAVGTRQGEHRGAKIIGTHDAQHNATAGVFNTRLVPLGSA